MNGMNFTQDSVFEKSNILKLIEDNITFDTSSVEIYSMEEIQGDKYSTDYKSFQSSTYNENLNTILTGFAPSESSLTQTCRLIELDLNYSPIRQTELDLGHCNDLTYNPISRIYCVAPGTDGFIGDVLVVSEDLTTVTRQHLGFEGTLLQISYSKEHDCYFGMTFSGLFLKIDSQLNNYYVVSTLSTISNPGDTPYYQFDSNLIRSILWQGSVILDEFYVAIIWLYGHPNLPSYARLVQFNLTTGNVIKFYDVTMSRGTYDEPESILFYKQKLKLISYMTENLFVTNIDYMSTSEKVLSRVVIDQTYSKLDDIPDFSSGYITLDASCSPIGQSLSGCYQCFGMYNAKTLIMYRSSTFSVYVNTKSYNGDWNGWYESYFNVCFPDRTYTDLNNVPVGTSGRISLSGSASPLNPTTLSGSYICYGNGNNVCIEINRDWAGIKYVNMRNSSGTWMGWKQIQYNPVS